MESKKLELFKSIVQIDYDDKYYDFHNDFDCVRMQIEDKELRLFFENISTKKMIKMYFTNIELIKLDFDIIKQWEATVDNIYRGRYEIKDNIYEFSDGKSYFYLEFYNGSCVEFFTNEIIIEEL